ADCKQGCNAKEGPIPDSQKGHGNFFCSGRPEMNRTIHLRLVQLLYQRHGMPARPRSRHRTCVRPHFQIREYFNSRAEIFGLLLLWKFEFNLEAIAECRVDALLETQHYLLKCGRSSG